MIEFGCKNCGQKLSVQEQHSGKRVKCPKCGSVGVVPDNSDKIKFHCDSCGQSISVPQIHAGKKGKCPKCKTLIVVPCLEVEPTGSAASGPSIPSDADEDLYEDESDLPEEAEGLDRRLIVAICGGAAVVVVGLIILVTVILPSGSGPVKEPDMSPRQEADAGSPSSPVAANAQRTGTSTLQPPKEDVAPREPAHSSTAASDKTRNLDLKFRLKPGQKHNLLIFKKTNSSLTIKGRQTDENFINTMGLEFKVEQVDPNGITWLKVTYLTIHDVAETVRGHMEYDSTKPNTATNRSGGSLFSAMIGQSFVAKVTPEGEIVELEGLPEMYLRMAEPMVKRQAEDVRRRSKGLRVTLAPIEKRIESKRKWLEMNSRTGEKAIREMLGNVIMPFPGGPVGIGDSWQARTALYSMGVGTLGLYDCTYTLRETEQAAVLVDISSKIEVDDEQPIPGADGSAGSSRTTLAGSCKGSLEIDPSTGWMLHKNVTIRYSGELKTAPTERTPQGATMGMSMEIVTTVKPME